MNSVADIELLKKKTRTAKKKNKGRFKLSLSKYGVNSRVEKIKAQYKR